MRGDLRVIASRRFAVPEKAVGRFALVLGFFDRCAKIHSLYSPQAGAFRSVAFSRSTFLTIPNRFGRLTGKQSHLRDFAQRA